MFAVARRLASTSFLNSSVILSSCVKMTTKLSQTNNINCSIRGTTIVIVEKSIALYGFLKGLGWYHISFPMAGKRYENLTPFQKFDLLGLMLGIRPSDMKAPSSNMAEFREDFAKAKHIVVLTGAGVSAESGVPTFRGAGGFWRKWQAQQLATPEAFDDNPSLVWEFYHYRREVMGSKEPNKAHLAIAECEKRLKPQGRRVVVITQNIDELHRRAGTENILELHGSLFKTRCTKCKDVRENRDSPICPALAGRGAPDPDAHDANIPAEKLPRCQKDSCGGLLRPHVVWFGESLDPEVLDAADEELSKCDLCLVVGTSSVVYPAAMFAPQVAVRGVPVAEFNPEETSVTNQLGYHFHGPAGTHVPVALAKHDSEG